MRSFLSMQSMKHPGPAKNYKNKILIADQVVIGDGYTHMLQDF